MVMSFTPRTTPEQLNDSSVFPLELDPVCYGVYAYEAQRPPMTELFFGVTWGLYALTCFVLLTGLYFSYILRKTPRFNAVRPFPWMVVFALSLWLVTMAGLIPLTEMNIPCWFTAAAWVLGMVGIIAAFFTRIVGLYVESEFARVANATKSRLLNESPESASAYSDQTSETMESVVLWRVVFTLIRSVFVANKSDSDSMTLHELAHARRAIAILYFMIMAPGVLAVGVLVAVVEPLRVCQNCDVYLDIWICILIFYGIGISVMVPAVLNVRKKLSVWGSVAEEVAALGAIDGPIITVGMLLIIVDPAGVAFQRQFAFQWLKCIGQIVCALIVMHWQIYRTYFPYQTKVSSTDALIPSMSATLQGDEAVSEEFGKFVAAHFMSELLNFVRDMYALKTYWYERNEAWRVARVTGIVTTYLTVGSVQEINISDRHRVEAKKAAANIKQSDREALHALEAVLAEVESMLSLGPWIDFYRARMRSSKDTTILSASAVAP